MCGEQLFAKADEIGERVGGEKKLIRIRAAVVPHGDRLASPDQLGAALPEISPPPPRQFRRTAVQLAIPTLHRQNGEPIADRTSSAQEGTRQRRGEPSIQRLIKRQFNAQRSNMRPEGSGGLQRCNPRKAHECLPQLTFLSFVTRPVSTHSVTKTFPSLSKHASWGWTNLPGCQVFGSMRILNFFTSAIQAGSSPR